MAIHGTGAMLPIQELSCRTCAGQCFRRNYHQLLLNLSAVSGQEILDRSPCSVLAYRLHVDGTRKEKLET